MKKFLRVILCITLALALTLSSCANAKVRQYRLQVVKEYPHDRTSYTQGLFFFGGQMYESTGLNGKSTFRKVDIATGKPLFRLNFDRRYFLEGSVEIGGNIYMLTWQNQVAFVYDAKTLTYKSTFSYPREGWGLTTDGKSLIASDGTSNLYFLDDNFKTVKTLPVRMDGRPVHFLNELEFIDGKVWANVYMSDLIVIIDPANGAVTGVVDCTGLLPDKLKYSDTDVLNGIAYNPADGKIYLTGKNWCRLYEVKLVEVR